MKLALVGYGTALPEFSIGFEEAWKEAAAYFCEDDLQARKLKLLYRMSGVKRRHSVVLDAPEGTPDRHRFFGPPKGENLNGPSIGARMLKYEQEALPLALRASREALAAAGLAPDRITHLVTISCSGFAAPGVDIGLIKGMGLSPHVERTHVGFMGCHGALNGLRVARSFIESNPEAAVLLSAVELCSLHYHYGWVEERLVANALFADGAATVVGVASDGLADDLWRIAGTGCCLVPDSEDTMSWRIEDHGFVMSLSARVPRLIADHLRAWLESWLRDHGLTLGDVHSWAVHPGGPRILEAVSKALDLSDEVIEPSREILRSHGNMSSPTILFILKRLKEAGACRPCVALGFGPGLMAEATLFT